MLHFKPLVARDLSASRLPFGVSAAEVDAPRSPSPTPGLALDADHEGMDATAAGRAFAAFTAPAPPSAPAAGGTNALGVRAPTVPATEGLRKVLDRATLDRLAVTGDRPGSAAVRTVKFLITNVDSGSPKAWIIDTNNNKYHFDFARKLLGLPDTNASLRQFNAETYFTDHRKFIAGTLVIHDDYVHDNGDNGLYSVEFWPTDPVNASHVNKAFDALTRALPFAKDKMMYHPAGDTQEALAAEQAASLKRMKVPVISTEKLFAGVTFSALNRGVGFGVLRVEDPANPSSTPPTVRDVVIFKNIPNDLSHVAGIITEGPQTPLSHINLKAQQNKTPNAFIKDASTDANIAPLIGQVVKYEVTQNGSYEIRAATQQEAEQWLQSVRPPKAQVPGRDLAQRKILPAAQLDAGQAKAYGAKTANLAELGKLLPGSTPQPVFGVPFAAYDDFMKENGLYAVAQAMMDDPRFQSDPAYREQQLTAFRRRIRNAAVPVSWSAELATAQAQFGANQPIRARSSTNNEDLLGFNGAGLYDSYTHRPNEGHLENTVKQTWASLWNFRAFEEREFWRIDHLTAAMGVTLQPNFDDEIVNGVAITKNIYDPNWPGFYINSQVGESLVTNPQPGAVPEEMLVSAIGPQGEYEVQRLRRSTESGGKPVMTDAQLQELVHAMERIQSHFQRVYNRVGDPTFAMDIEFKFDLNGKLVVKQARPVVQ